jgi:hypothetical protein
MVPRSGDEPKHDFPAGIGQPATQALAAAGYTNLDQLSRVTESELLKLHGMGRRHLVLSAAPCMPKDSPSLMRTRLETGNTVAGTPENRRLPCTGS